MKIIKRIKIRNFRSLYDYDSKNITDLNIFAGQNDSGKSNVLKALNLFFNNETSFGEPFSFTDDYSKHALFKAREKAKGKQFISITIFFNHELVKGSELYKNATSNSEGIWVEKRWWQDGSKDEKKSRWYDGNRSGIKRAFNRYINRVRFVYIPALKNASVFSHVLKLAAHEEDGFIINEDATKVLESAIADNELQSAINHATKDLSDDFAQLTGINAKITLPLSLKAFFSALKVNTIYPEIVGKKIKVGKEEDYLIDFLNRGDGIKSIFIPVLLRWVALNSKQHWIWGIDEPENSLEMSKANGLLEKLIKYTKDAQIFASSHSPVFIFSTHKKIVSVNIASLAESTINTTFVQIGNDWDKAKEKLMLEFGSDYTVSLEAHKEYAEQLRNKDEVNEKLSEEVRKLEKLSHPILYTEGNNTEYIKVAKEFFSPELSLELLSFGGKDDLKNLFSKLRENDFTRHKCFFIFDCDATKEFNTCNDKKTEHLLPYIFPVNQDNTLIVNGIENLFAKNLFTMENGRFFDTTTTYRNRQQIAENKKLRKSEFEKFINHERKNNDDFINFKHLFDFMKMTLEN